MLFKRKKRFEVDLGEMKDEGESLVSFLRSNIKTSVTLNGSKVSIESETLSSQELKRLVTKFIYHRNLNNQYWVSSEDSVAKIRKFKGVEKKEKRKKEGTPPATITHGW